MRTNCVHQDRHSISGCLLLLSLLLSPGCSSYTCRVVKWNFFSCTPYGKVANKPAPSKWSDQRVTATWIGHATVLINFHGTTILTDPVLVKRIPFHPFGIRRITELPLKYEDLPPIDIVLLSHAHRDHWDMASLRKFDGTPTAVIPTGNSDLIPKGRFAEIVELGWKQSTTIKSVTIRALEMEHWGRRWNSPDHARGYNGYVLSNQSCRLVFLGDTGAHKTVRTATEFGSKKVNWNERVGKGPFDFCVIPIGEGENFMSHISPELAWDIFKQINGKLMMPIHWRTFILSEPRGDPLVEPLETLRKAAGGEAHKIVGATPGETVVVE